MNKDQGKGGVVGNILTPSFRYTSSVETDLRKTFAKARRALRDKEEARKHADADALTKVLPIDHHMKGKRGGRTQ